ncbi:hypothetical protein [Acinetobacter indicus]|uniref:hypothetical protein n=1 Tax=Acinetobacter indicus TaxID=756892 RepID=UPI00197C59DF|nr:hypothetical protein [Acinetobacter indicus]QSG85114.1 hypothetical protein JYB86_03025 [Acinetobacter indicus]
MSGFIIIDSMEKSLILIGFLIAIPSVVYIIFLYYYNKYYTRKYKNDFFYLFWGYEDTENKMSADKHLSLFIYHFITAYELNSYNFFHKRYKFFPENIKDMDPTSFMPNATKGNLENFEKKHMKWIRFNIISQHIIVCLALIVVVLFFWAEYMI